MGRENKLVDYSSGQLRWKVVKAMFDRDRKSGLNEANRVLTLLNSRMAEREGTDGESRLKEVKSTGR